MRRRLWRAVPVVAVAVLGVSATPAIEWVKGSDSGVVVHEVSPTTPDEEQDMREALEYRERTGKWPCPEGGVVPQQTERPRDGVSDLARQYGPDEYDC